jgi:hypothetical protein
MKPVILAEKPSQEKTYQTLFPRGSMKGSLNTLYGQFPQNLTKVFVHEKEPTINEHKSKYSGSCIPPW